MKITSKLLLSMFALVFIGQGCFGSGTPVADGGMFQSGDIGETWEQLNAFPQLSGVGSIGGVNVLDLEIDPNDESVYYIGTAQNGVFFSLDYGRTWQRPEDPFMQEGAFPDIEVDPKNSCLIYALRGSELLRSGDCARNFSSLYQQAGGDVALTSLEVDWFNPDVIWMGTSDGDMMRSVDAGNNWKAINRVGDRITDIELSNADSRIVMVGTEDKGFYYSNDGGDSWFEFEDALSEKFRDSDEVHGFSQTEDGSVVLMNTTYGILVSKDAGENWDALPLITAPGEIRIWDIEIDPNNKNNVYYSVFGTMYISQNGGATWTTQPLPSTRAATVIESHEKVDGLILAGFATIEN